MKMKSLLEISYAIIDSPVGELILYGNRDCLLGLGFLKNTSWSKESDVWTKDPRIFKETTAQLRQYFDGNLKQFSVPFSPSGTQFQLNVYRQLLKIPYGETRSYSEIAEAVGNPKAVRAIGSANSRNPIAIIIPCHRVIGRDGSMTGFAGGLESKKALLGLERAV